MLNAARHGEKGAMSRRTTPTAAYPQVRKILFRLPLLGAGNMVLVMVESGGELAGSYESPRGEVIPEVNFGFWHGARRRQTVRQTRIILCHPVCCGRYASLVAFHKDEITAPA